MYTCIHVSVPVRVSVYFVCLCTYVICLYVYMCVYVCICICVYVYVQPMYRCTCIYLHNIRTEGKVYKVSFSCMHRWETLGRAQPATPLQTKEPWQLSYGQGT